MTSVLPLLRWFWLSCLAVGPLWSASALSEPGPLGAGAAASPAVELDAAPDAKARQRVLVVPAGRGQPRLVVERRAAELVAALCRATCDWTQAARVPLEPELDASKLRAEVVEIGQGRRAAHLTVEAAMPPWHWLVAAPLEGAAPVVAFAGRAGLTEGEAPERSGAWLELLKHPDGRVDVVVGRLREDVSLCGRRALLAPRLLYAKDLTLRRIKLQRLDDGERQAAPRLVADPEKRSGPPLLRARVASSATGDPGALTDDDPATYWAENRSGNGGGEFVVMRAPPTIPLQGFSFSLLPAPANPQGVAPKQIWLATDAQLYAVEFPVDARAGGSGEFVVTLPEPVSTTCVGLVLDEAFGDAPAAQVTLADLGAVAVDGALDLERALTDLDRGGEAARQAEAVLGVLGEAAFEALSRRYLSLSEGGRVRALRVMDQAPCEHAATVYVAALSESREAERRQASSSVRRCGKRAADVIVRLLPKLDAERTRALAPLLTELDPARAVAAVVPILDGVSSEKRAILRQSVSRAARTEAGRPQVAAWIDGESSRRQVIELMRALGPELERYRERAVALIRGWNPKSLSYEERYLLVEPMARLSQREGMFSARLSRWMHGDPALPVRARAAQHTPPDAAGLPALLRALEDPEVRVREAAVMNLGRWRVASAEPRLLRVLSDDPWPLVRAATVRALARLPKTRGALRALARAAAEDESSHVRRPAVLSLGRLRAASQLPVVRERFASDEDPHVRAAAAAVLGQLCDAAMEERLLEAALKVASLQASEDELIVGRASVLSLGRLAPRNLEKKLAPLLDAEALPPARRAARAALSHANACNE